MTPKEMVEATAAEFKIMADCMERNGRALEGAVGSYNFVHKSNLEYECKAANYAGMCAAYRHAAESLRKLLALKGWE